MGAGHISSPPFSALRATFPRSARDSMGEQIRAGDLPPLPFYVMMKLLRALSPTCLRLRGEMTGYPPTLPSPRFTRGGECSLSLAPAGESPRAFGEGKRGECHSKQREESLPHLSRLRLATRPHKWGQVGSNDVFLNKFFWWGGGQFPAGQRRPRRARSW